MPDEPRPRIVIDEDWKTQVEAEKETAAGEPAGPVASGDAQRGPLPPASFPLLLTSLASQALVALGQVPDPLAGKAQVDLDQARHVIDTLGVLEEKTRGNLTADESAMLSRLLHDLRLAFVAVRQHGQPAGTPAAAAP